MRIFFTVMAVIFLAVFALCEYGCGHVTGRGTRVGTIIKLADEGWFNKTHEIEIIRGGMSAANGGFGVKPFYATITDNGDWQKAQQFFDSQTEVEVSYTETFGSFWSSECNGEDENCAFVTGIRAK